MKRDRRCSKVKKYQEFVYGSMKGIFGEDMVRKEWDVAKDTKDDFTRELYCPRLDVAVGPFNIDRNIEYNNRQIESALQDYRGFIDKIYYLSDQSSVNIEEFLEKRNKNPRCFLAIEIENSGSSKHMVGNIANVSILGSIGIIVPFNDKQLSLCKRVKEYVAFATVVEKVNVIFENVLVIDKENFLKVFENIDIF